MLLAGCGGHCRDQPRPDTISLDASGLAGAGTDFEVCILPDKSNLDHELCSEVGSYLVSWSSAEPLPDTFGYVARWRNDDQQTELIRGEFDLLCVAGTASYSLGPSY